MILCWVKTGHFRAVASVRQIQAITSTIFVSISVVSFFMVESKLLLGREFNCGHCLSQIFFLTMALQ